MLSIADFTIILARFCNIFARKQLVSFLKTVFYAVAEHDQKICAVLVLIIKYLLEDNIIIII